jgi:hypothetical protein
MSEQAKETLEKLPELETVCDRCRGQWSGCSDCGGTGYIPTDFGEKVLSLVLHHVRLDADSVSRRW